MLFFGDNGQGDLMCAERLTGMNVGGEGTGVGGMVSAAFIHQVRHGLHLDVLCCDLRGRNGRWIRYMELLVILFRSQREVDELGDGPNRD